jgi:Family of unknown function (DUF6282)
VAALAYDLHLHPGPSSVPRWGDGHRVWRAAVDAGVDGFVWKSHEEHTVERCRELPSAPVWAIPSASLNPWSRFDDVVAAVEAGARWIWGPTMTAAGEIGWDLPLPSHWDDLAAWLADRRPRIVLATGHLGPKGRSTFASAAAKAGVTCSVTHSLFLPLAEASALAATGCAFEIDAYTYVHAIDGRQRSDLVPMLRTLGAAGATVYFTSDGGQAATGDPFAFGRRVLADVAGLIGADAARRLAFDGPRAIVAGITGAAT